MIFDKIKYFFLKFNFFYIEFLKIVLIPQFFKKYIWMNENIVRNPDTRYELKQIDSKIRSLRSLINKCNLKSSISQNKPKLAESIFIIVSSLNTEVIE